MASGEKLMLKKDYTRAVIQFRNAAAVMPKDAEVYYQLGLAYLGAGDIRRGYASLKKSVELNPAHVGAQVKIAQLQSATDDPDLLKDSEKRLESLLNDSGNDADTLNTLAFTEMKLGNLSAATQHLEALLASSPQQLITSVLLANTKLAQKDVNGAEQVLKAACLNNSKSADAVMMLGKFYASLSRLPDAELEFRKAVQIAPRNGEALSLLAQLQYAEGHKQAAEQDFKRLSQFPDSNYNFMYGLFLFQENRNSEAVREMERLAKAYPDDRPARTRLVAAYARVGRTADAQAMLARALKKNSRDTDALLERGELSMGQKNYGSAEADFNEVLHERPDAAEVHYLLAKLNQARGTELVYRQELTEALRLNPGLLPVRLELSQYLLQGKGAQSALELLDETPAGEKGTVTFLVARNWALWALGDMDGMRKGIDEGLAKERSADLLIQDGVWKLRAKKPLEARSSLDEALNINPTDLRALQALAQTYAAEKGTATAIQKVKEYAARQPKSAAVQQFLGVMLMAQGDRSEARDAFLAAKRADPQFVPADMSLVQFYVADRDLSGARKLLEGLVKDNKGSTTALLWLGNIQLMQGNTRGAIQAYRQVLAVDSSNGIALNNLAYLLSNDPNTLDEALNYAQKAKELAPANSEIDDTLGWLLYQKGIYETALRYLQSAASTKASSPEAGARRDYHLAMAYYKMGQDRLSRATLQKAIEADPILPEAQLARQLIQPDGSR